MALQLKKWFYSSLLLIFGLSFYACSYNKLELPAPKVDTTIVIDQNSITYTNFTKSLINNNHCLECHSGPSPAAGRDYSTYSGIKDVALNGQLMARAINGVAPTMPYGYPELNQGLKDTLTLWINQGAIE